MVRVKMGEEIVRSNIKARVRFDFKGVQKPNRFLFGGKSTEKVALEARDHQAALIRNVPVQGIYIEDMNTDIAPYTMLDENRGEQVAYAPMELTVCADTIEDLIRFVMREEFRKIEILEPEQMFVTKYDAERFLFRMNEELRLVTSALKKVNER